MQETQYFNISRRTNYFSLNKLVWNPHNLKILPKYLLYQISPFPDFILHCPLRYAMYLHCILCWTLYFALCCSLYGFAAFWSQNFKCLWSMKILQIRPVQWLVVWFQVKIRSCIKIFHLYLICLETTCIYLPIQKKNKK